MMLSADKRRELVEAALGKRPLDLAITNAKLVNVFTGEIYPADVGIYQGFIAHVQADPDGVRGETPPPLEGTVTIDASGSYLIPGLVDSHVHIESSMMTPANFAGVIIPHGTTTAITDPHEIGNVLGVPGVRYMLEASEDLPMRQYILVPSCVPSVMDLETAGACFGTKEVAEMLDWERVLGVAEVMDFPGVITGSERMRGILDQAHRRGAFIQGHSPTLTDRALSAYLCAGPESDHEVRVGSEAREKMRLGMTIDARESSMSRNLDQLIPAIRDFNAPPNLTFCTDDREPADLLYEGHMNHVVRRAIEEGMEPTLALRAATLQAARNAGLANLGAIAPGYAADMALVPSLEGMNPSHVFFAGKLVAQDGEMTVSLPKRTFDLEQENTVHLDKLRPGDFAIKAPIEEGTIPTRVLTYQTADSLFARFEVEDLPVRGGEVDISGQEGLRLVAVFNRHGAPENRFVGIIRDFGLERGAIGSTISHDCHNLTVVASDPIDAALACNTLRECGGGIVCTRDGEVLDLVQLPIAGLMSPLAAEELAPRTSHLKDTIREMGIPGEDPLLRIATLTLAVIPEAKITDQGLVAVNEQKLVPLFPK